MCEKKRRFYVGITTNIEKRLTQHGSPKLLYKEGPFLNAGSPVSPRVGRELILVLTPKLEGKRKPLSFIPPLPSVLPSLWPVIRFLLAVHRHPSSDLRLLTSDL
jgi:hypothetical protein